LHRLHGLDFSEIIGGVEVSIDIKTTLETETCGLTQEQGQFVHNSINEKVKHLANVYHKYFEDKIEKMRIKEKQESERRLVELCNTPCWRYVA
jgi:hypothetical protein